MTNINMVDKQRIMFHDDAIPISENYKEDVLHFLDQHTMA